MNQVDAQGATEQSLLASSVQCRTNLQTRSAKLVENRTAMSMTSDSNSQTLSVLDTGPPEETIDLASRIESWGYDRLWVTEHHTESQSACPSVMAAAVLASTTDLSVTVGGVLARIHSPYFIAQQLKLLARLFGGRIQFGVAGTLPDGSIRNAIKNPIAESPDAYRDRLIELRDLALKASSAASDVSDADQSVDASDRTSHPSSRSLTIGPTGAEPDSFVICGTSEKSATLTAEFGFPFAFHDFQSPQEQKEDRIIVCRKYKDLGGKHLSVAVSGLCATSKSDAEGRWEELNRGRHTRVPSFLGPADECADQIAKIANEMNADEIVIQPLSTDLVERLNTLESLFEPLRARLGH